MLMQVYRKRQEQRDAQASRLTLPCRQSSKRSPFKSTARKFESFSKVVSLAPCNSSQELQTNTECRVPTWNCQIMALVYQICFRCNCVSTTLELQHNLVNHQQPWLDGHCHVTFHDFHKRRHLLYTYGPLESSIASMNPHGYLDVNRNVFARLAYNYMQKNEECMKNSFYQVTCTSHVVTCLAMEAAKKVLKLHS